VVARDPPIREMKTFDRGRGVQSGVRMQQWSGSSERLDAMEIGEFHVPVAASLWA